MSRYQDLIAAATQARAAAYAPYSSFAVGAALLAADGRVFTGCNVENASYGLTICAERAAICSAIAANCREFAALAVVSEGGAFPCGACRQVLAEFAPNLRVLLVDAGGHEPVRELTLAELLPHRFRFGSGA